MTRNQGKAGTLAALVAVLAVAAGCGKSATDVNAPATTAGTDAAATTGGTAAPADTQSVTSPAPTGDVTDPLVWGVYRETNTLDPIFAFDYPENTVLFNMCEAILEQQPDGSIADGVGAVSSPDPTTFVITLKDGITFWDGKPLTADDVVFSLGRARDAKLGGFYPQVFARVKDIKATGPLEVTITMTEPDYWFRSELSGPPGVVLEKAFVESKADKFGTVDGGTMCTGPYKLDSWKTGEGVTVVKNDTYWDPAAAGKVAKLTFKGYSDDAAVTSAFLTGELDGYYPLQLTTLDQLKNSPEVKVYQGPSAASDAMIVSSYKGVLGDVRVRKALSMAIDRQPLIDQLYKGAAELPHALSGPGTWGYAPDVFKAAWDALPAPVVDLEGAKALIKEAGAEGKTIRLGTSAELLPLNTEAQAVQSAAQSIGLKAELESTSAANYINFFIDPEARKNVDGFFTINYGDYSDPAALLSTLVLEGGSQNFGGYNNPEVTKEMEAARGEADDTKRAEHVVAAQKIITEEVAWIPMAAPDTVLVMNKAITGAPTSFVYMFGPWLSSLGAAG
jgi:peptide/nickel transport system substrate-binding protein